MEIEKKSKRMKEPSLYEVTKRRDLMHSDEYLYSFDEARKLLRMAREKFVNEYIKKNKIPVTLLEDGKQMIRRLNLKLYLDQCDRNYKEA